MEHGLPEVVFEADVGAEVEEEFDGGGFAGDGGVEEGGLAAVVC